jgi:hypothetical protein
VLKERKFSKQQVITMPMTKELENNSFIIDSPDALDKSENLP